MTVSRPLVGALLIALAVPTAARGQQVFESTGTRALGMGGAFVAVADDPSAVFWNPAGLVVGPPGGATIEWLRFRTGDRSQPSSIPGANQRTSFLTSMGTWPLGLSYAKFEQQALISSPSGVVVETVRVGQYTATLLQTVAPGLTVGANLKLLRSTLFGDSPLGGTAGDALEAAPTSTGEGTTSFDVDLGAIYADGPVRVGLTVKNLRQPELARPAASPLAPDALRLQRQARAGLAVLPTSGLTLAMDVDLDAVTVSDGARRMIAFGAEQRLTGSVYARGGVRWNLRGDRRAVGSAGASVQLRPHLWIDVEVTGGNIAGDRGWGVGMRAGL